MKFNMKMLVICVCIHGQSRDQTKLFLLTLNAENAKSKKFRAMHVSIKITYDRMFRRDFDPNVHQKHLWKR